MYLSKFNIKNIIRNFTTIKLQQLPEVTVIRKITQDDLNRFSSLCEDSNPIHTETVPEDERYVHGAFLNSLVSGLIGTKIPGPGTIVISQKFKFPRRCKINQDIEMNVKLIEDRKIMKVSYYIKQNQQIVFVGEANLIRRSSIKVDKI